MFACLPDCQLLYLALFDCFFVCSPDWLFSLIVSCFTWLCLTVSLFDRPIGCFLYFKCLLTSHPLGCHCLSLLPLLSQVLPAVHIHVSACGCSYSLPLPPPPPLSLSPLSVCLPACLSDCLSVCPSVCLSVCLSVSVSHPHLPPPPSLSLSSSPSFSTSLLPSPCVLCPLFFNLFCFGFSVVILFCFLSCGFFFPLDFLLHVQVLSVCNIALAVCILGS